MTKRQSTGTNAGKLVADKHVAHTDRQLRKSILGEPMRGTIISSVDIQSGTETRLSNAVNRTQKASVCHHGQSAVLGIPMYTHAISKQRDFGASIDDYSGNEEGSA